MMDVETVFPIVIFVFFVIFLPILLGSFGLFIAEYCLRFDVNWGWFSRWLFGLFGSIGLGLTFRGD